MKLKKILAAFLAIAMLFSTAIVPVSAEETEPETIADSDNNLYVSCDYNSETEGYGKTKFSNYAGAYAYAVENNKTSATIVVEKTNTLSGNTFDNNHKAYTKLAVVIKDGATMGNALSKWDMTYPVTVEAGGTLTCARPISSSVSNIHIKNKLIIGEQGSDKKAYCYFLSDSYQDCDISIRYNGSVTVANAVMRVQDLDAQGSFTAIDSDITVDGAFASTTSFFYKTTLTNSKMKIGGMEISGGLSDFSGGDSNQLGNVTLNGNSSMEFEEGSAVKVAANVSVDGSSSIKADKLTVNKNQKIDVKGTSSVSVQALTNNGTIATVAGATVTAKNVSAESTGKVTVDGEDAKFNEDGVVTQAVPIVKIGEEPYETLAEALNAAKDMSGDVTVEIYDKVTLSESLNGSYSSIKFVGKNDKAEIYLDIQGYITAPSKKVAFENLKLSKSSGGFVDNAGFMNLAFGVYEAAEVSYTGCTFINGAYASSGKNTFTECTFYRSHDRYGLWAYGSDDITVDNCIFDDFRGIKMYDEGGSKITAITVKNSDFSVVNDKPAIVLTYGNSVTLENNTYSSTGVFELEDNGSSDGTHVTSDKEVTCVSKSYPDGCGVMVDGKIYRTVESAANAAIPGETAVLLYDTDEAAEFKSGVTMDKNGKNAPNVTNSSEGLVYIGKTPYDTLQKAVEAVKDGETITLYGELSGDTDFVQPKDKSFTIDGKGTAIYTGTIKFRGSGDPNKATNPRITIKGINFKTTETVHDFISSSNTNFYPVVTIENCHFTGHGSDSTVVAVRLKSSYKCKILNCIATGLHSFLQNRAGWDMEIDGVTITDSGSGLKLDSVQNATVKNVKIEAKKADGYGILFNAELDTENVIENCDIDAFVPVSVREADGTNKYKLTVNGTNAFTSKNPYEYSIIASNKEYKGTPETLVQPNATVEVKLNDSSISREDVFGATWYAAYIGEKGYKTLADALKAANPEEETLIELSPVENSEETINFPTVLKNVTIKGAEGQKSVLKDTVLMAATGNGITYENLKFDSIVFDNSRLNFTGWRSKTESFKNWEITNCVFKNIVATGNAAAVHFVLDAEKPFNGFVFKNNVIDGVSGSSNSGVYITGGATGNIEISGNVINNVAFRPYILHIQDNDGVEDSVTVTGNTFSGSAAGRAQALGTGSGTDSVELIINENIFKDITSTQQICYYNFADTATKNFGKNYYDIDISENPGKIYFNKSAESVTELVEMGIYPIYRELNEDGTIKADSLFSPLPAAKIGEKTYYSVNDAINAAEEGATVTLLKNAESVIDKGDKKIFIDLGEYAADNGFKSNGIEVKFDDAALAKINANSDGVFSVAAKTASAEAISGTAPAAVYEITVTDKDGDAAYSESNATGKATVTIPYDLGEEKVAYVYYITKDNSGKQLAKLVESTVSEDGKSITFEAAHFSTYAIVEGNEGSTRKVYTIKAEAIEGAQGKFYNPGDTLKVNLSISSEEIDSLGAFQFSFGYDETMLKLQDIETTLKTDDGNFYSSIEKKRITFDVDGTKPVLDIAGGRTVATLVFKVLDDASGESKIYIDTTKVCEVSPQGYNMNEAAPTIIDETVTLKDIVITFKSGDNASFKNGESEFSAHVNYNTPGFVEPDFKVPASELIANEGYRMASDKAGEELWKDEDGNKYTSEELLTTRFTENTTLTACVVKTWKVTLVTDTNGTLEGQKELVVDEGTEVTKEMLEEIVTPVGNPGYEFNEWESLGTINNNTEITATFKNAEYAFSAETGSTDVTAEAVSGIAENKATHGTEVIVSFTASAEAAEAITEVGYTVDGVKYFLGDEVGEYTIPADAITGVLGLYVTEVGKFTVTFTTDENGYMESEVKFNISKGSTVTDEHIDEAMDKAKAKPGYKFVYFSLDGKKITKDEMKAEEIFEDTTFTAEFDHESYTLKDVNGNDETVTHGTDYTFVPEIDGKIVTNVTATYANGDECEITKNDDGSYTIAGDDIIDAITLAAETVDGSISFILNRDYKALKGRITDDNVKIAVLETAKLTDKKYVLSESGAAFYWSEKYNAYLYIVPGMTENEGMTEAMIASQLIVKDGAAEEISYEGDMNGDKNITVTDAMIITDILYQKRLVGTSILQRLMADVNYNKYVSTQDVDIVRKDAQD